MLRIFAPMCDLTQRVFTPAMLLQHTDPQAWFTQLLLQTSALLKTQQLLLSSTRLHKLIRADALIVPDRVN